MNILFYIISNMIVGIIGIVLLCNATSTTDFIMLSLMLLTNILCLTYWVRRWVNKMQQKTKRINFDEMTRREREQLKQYEAKLFIKAAAVKKMDPKDPE